MQNLKSYLRRNNHARSASLNLKLFTNFGWGYNSTLVVKNRINTTQVRVNTSLLRNTDAIYVFQHNVFPFYIQVLKKTLYDVFPFQPVHSVFKMLHRVSIVCLLLLNGKSRVYGKKHVKSVRIRSYSGPHFPWTGYGQIRKIRTRTTPHMGTFYAL